jgi:ferredoxin
MSEDLISPAAAEDFFERLQRSGWTADPSTAAAKIAALAALSDLPEPEPVAIVSYVSRGMLLVIAPREAADSALATAETLKHDLDVHLLCPDSLAAAEGFLAWEGKAQSLKGFLGAFEVTWSASGVEKMPAPSPAGQSAETVVLASSGEAPVVQFDVARKLYTGHFDLILDFSIPAHFMMPQPPQGYFAVGRDLARLEAACAELVDMVGEFEKPKFFAYNEKICAHSRSEITGCTLCIDVCSTRAIVSEKEQNRVKVEPHLCMGCGACASVCPSGAMTYAYPRVADMGVRIKAVLQTYRNAGGKAACLLFHNAGDGRELVAMLGRRGKGLPANVIPLEVLHTAALGLDLMLGSFALGAAQFAILCTGSEAPDYLAALRYQLGLAQQIVAGLGYGEGHFSLIEAQDVAGLEQAVWNLGPAGEMKPATFNLFNDKRTTLDFVFDHLLKHAPQPQEQIALAAGAPYGQVVVNKQTCTLCMACVGACPENALLDFKERPQLRFIERNCVQCGLCEKTCPEDAISLAPRLLLGKQAKVEVVLNEAEVFACIKCGKPFATKQIIDHMLGRLASHSMFAEPGALELLKMCADCRVIDLLQNAKHGSILDLK